MNRKIIVLAILFSIQSCFTPSGNEERISSYLAHFESKEKDIQWLVKAIHDIPEWSNHDFKLMRLRGKQEVMLDNLQFLEPLNHGREYYDIFRRVDLYKIYIYKEEIIVLALDEKLNGKRINLVYCSNECLNFLSEYEYYDRIENKKNENAIWYIAY